MTTKTKKRLYLLIGLGISVVLLYALFQNINFSDLTAALSQANYWWLLPNIMLIVLTMYQRAYRWSFMIAPIKKVPFEKLLAATCVGFMANNVLPLRLGEFVRAYSLSDQDKDVSKSASLATIFVERMVFDLVALLLILAGVLSLSPLSVDGRMVFGLKLAVGTALVAIAVMVFMAIKPETVGRVLTRYLFFLPDQIKSSISSIVIKFSHGLAFLTSLKSVTYVSIQTIMIWLLMGISNIFVFWAFGFDLTVDACYVLLVVVSISILIPSSPGFIGVYHAGVVMSLDLYGIPKADALSCALVLHATQYFVVTLMGFYFLKKEHLSLKELEQEAEEE